MNLKSYPSSLGPGALRIGRTLERLAGRSGVPAAVAPAAPDLGVLARALSIPVLAQHVDPVGAGAMTGHLVPEAVRAAGARGSLVNHSEHPLTFPATRATVGRLRELLLVPVVCARDVTSARRLAALRPPYLAVEPPELIGGDRAVSTARPEVISDSVAAVRSVSPTTRVLCGAGVHDRDDVHRAIELGARGVLVSSAVTRAANPARAIAELLAGF